MSRGYISAILEGLNNESSDRSLETLDREKDAKALHTHIETQLKKLLGYSKKVTKTFRPDMIEFTFNLDKWESKHLKSGATLKKWVKDSGINVKGAKVTATKDKRLTGWSSDSADGFTYSLVIKYEDAEVQEDFVETPEASLNNQLKKVITAD